MVEIIAQIKETKEKMVWAHAYLTQERSLWNAKVQLKFSFQNQKTEGALSIRIFWS